MRNYRLGEAMAWIEKHGGELRKASIQREAAALAKYRQARYSRDPAYRRLVGMRHRFLSMLKKDMRGEGVKRRKTQTCRKLCGCDLKEMVEHIEKQFQEGMTWENHGKGRADWVLDHIKPVCLFDWWTWEGLQQAFHWSNVQPLWYWQHREKCDEDRKLARIRAMDDPDYASRLMVGKETYQP